MRELIKLVELYNLISNANESQIDRILAFTKRTLREGTVRKDVPDNTQQRRMYQP